MRDNVCIMIPTLNEGKTIGKLVRAFRDLGFQDVLVIDGHSQDNTVAEARAAGARVVVQNGKGKGIAVRQAFNMIDKEITVMVDGDGTYLPEEVDLLIGPVYSGAADHVLGNRFANYGKGAFTRLNLIGNKILNSMFNFAYHARLHDILTGYRAFNKNAVRLLSLNQAGFGIEAEMTVECLKKDLRMCEVPITYRAREDGSPTKLNPLKDGFKIGYTMYKLGKTYNPMLYLTALSIAFITAGFIIGIYVVIEQYLNSTPHNLWAILTTLLIISGVQIFIFGYIVDMIVQLQREMMGEIRKK
ncbi:MAG TPA: S-layer glycoprotein N-glycosyltransferase AglJ [Methanocella sp.]|nr:S-layer glycoprotein N-glycosyltransferase AglJ [Methanocella sp.]